MSIKNKTKSPEVISENTEATITPGIISVDVVQAIGDNSFQPEVDNIRLKDGQILFVEVDINGNETNPATTSKKTFEQYYQNAVHKGTDQPKYKLKKK